MMLAALCFRREKERERKERHQKLSCPQAEKVIPGLALTQSKL